MKCQVAHIVPRKTVVNEVRTAFFKNWFSLVTQILGEENREDVEDANVDLLLVRRLFPFPLCG
jgi:hypothetical protein